MMWSLVGENKDSGKYARNGYLSLSLFSPIYSALSNPNGAPGDVMFRRTAYELLAAKVTMKDLSPCFW